MNVSTNTVRKALEAWHLVEPALFVPHTEGEYRQLVALLDRLIDEVGEDEAHPLASLMEVIGVLIEKYEDAHVPALGSNQSVHARYHSARPSRSLTLPRQPASLSK